MINIGLMTKRGNIDGRMLSIYVDKNKAVKFKVKCAMAGVSMTGLIEAWIDSFLKSGEQKPVQNELAKGNAKD